MTEVAILGAGPAGLGAALGLARKGYEVVVLEQSDRVGGNAGSFELAGVRVDYGSHRFHPAADPAVFALVRDLLGADLLERPRHGRILLRRRWIHFPLRAVDLARHADPIFTGGVLRDMARKAVVRRAHSNGRDETFATVLERGLGPTICRDFFFPYARKIWGLEPDEISSVQAYKRVSAGSIAKLLSRLVPRRMKSDGRRKGIFYYPKYGYGQICERLRDAAEAAGAQIRLETAVRSVELDPARAHRVETQSAGTTQVLSSRHVWSTIPVTTLVRVLRPCAPPTVVDAASRLELRAMALVYLVLETDRFTEFDAHYFPGAEVPFTRVSEPKNYSGVRDPSDVTVLCAEIPCSRNDDIWSQPDDQLGSLVADGLARAGLPLRCRIREVTVRRLGAAYPIYRRGYETHFTRIDDWVETLDGLLSFGRQGLYAHDNTHHALFMAQAAVACLNNGALDRTAWRRYRQLFEQHVVED